MDVKKRERKGGNGGERGWEVEEWGEGREWMKGRGKNRKRGDVKEGEGKGGK